MGLRPRFRLLTLGAAAALSASTLSLVGGSVPARGSSDDVPKAPDARAARAAAAQESEGPAYQAARQAYFESRYLAGTNELSPEAAGKYRAAAADKATRTGRGGPLGPGTADASWQSIGPASTVQYGRTSFTPQSVSGRVSALALDSTGAIYLGAAQGGLWRYTPASGAWTPLTDNLPSLAVGAVAVAPSDENVVYLATGEGDLSGDSYYGDGVWRSTDRGAHWTHVSGTTFPATSITRLVVDPHDANVVYVATIRGRGGARRVSPPTNQTWGVYRSGDGGTSWSLLKGTTDPSKGATDVEIDPNDSNILYMTFWNDSVGKFDVSSNTWTDLTPNVAAAITPTPDFSQTRFSVAAVNNGGVTRLYLGFDWYNATDGAHRVSRLFRSDDAGATWHALPRNMPDPVDSVANYCDIQCTYDNVIEADPSNPDVVYAAGEYNYGLVSGGIYRSLDGGQTWKSLGFDLHPDFHALAFQPGDPAHVVIGNDGGVWDSPDMGGRLGADDTLDKVDWTNLNGNGLDITQFDSIDYANPATHPNRFWGGTQDNGTQRKSSLSNNWFDVSSGDGGQVVVDHQNDSYVFGTYYNLTGLYRYDDGGNFFTNHTIMNGIQRTDRSEFYIPLVQNAGDRNQLVTGTYRVYRSDNAETPVPADVEWHAISGDLTSGCTGAAGNGGRGCVISALGISDGGDGMYAGTEEGWVWHAANGLTSDSPTWVRSDSAGSVLPGRPVTSFAVDRSNWRVAYASFAGYNAATPGHNGHIFKTTDGGATWTDVTGNLPDNPVNSVLVDPADGKTLFAGSDVGVFVSRDGGASWQTFDAGLPNTATWQLAYDPSRALLVDGTHGRGAWKLGTGRVEPAFTVRTTDPGVPVGPGVDIPYTLTVRNIGDATASGVVVSDPIPAHTTVKTIGEHGAVSRGAVLWSGLKIPAGGQLQLHLTVTIDRSLPASTTQIVNDGIHVSSAQGPATDGSPHTNAIARKFDSSLTPSAQVTTGQAGKTGRLVYRVTNTGWATESYTVSADSTWPATAFSADCTTPLPGTLGPISPGGSTKVCLVVNVPADSAGTTDAITVHSTPADAPANDATASGSLISVAHSVLLVDEDFDAPDVRSYYANALTAAGVGFDVWDIKTQPDLPVGYLNGYDSVYWFTGTAYPDPLGSYEKGLIAYLDQGGHVAISGQDILDQSAGTTPFFTNYVHINWDGSEAQNDKPTAAVHGSSGSPLGGGFGDVPLDLSVLNGAQFSDELTPTGPATVDFTDDQSQPDGITVAGPSPATGTAYKLAFFAFPVEEFGTATDKSSLVSATETFFHGG